MKSVDVNPELISKLKASGCDIVSELENGRVLISVKLNQLVTDDYFADLRNQEPNDKAIEPLVESIQKKGAFYPILVYADLSDTTPEFVVVDGRQRLRSMEKSGIESAYVIVGNWSSRETAFNDAVSTNFARYEVGEADLRSIIVTRRISLADLAKQTGYSETKLREIDRACKYPELEELFDKKALSTGRFSSLLTACGECHRRIKLLLATLMHFYAIRKEDALKIQAKLKDRSKRWPSSMQQKAKIANCFRSEDWKSWVDALGQGEIEARSKSVNGVEILDLVQNAKPACGLGSPSEWKESFAFFGLEGRKHSDVDLATLNEFVADLPAFAERVTAVRDHLVRTKSLEEAKLSFAIPGGNPEIDDLDELSTEPIPQDVSNMTIVTQLKGADD